MRSSQQAVPGPAQNHPGTTNGRIDTIAEEQLLVERMTTSGRPKYQPRNLRQSTPTAPPLTHLRRIVEEIATQPYGARPPVRQTMPAAPRALAVVTALALALMAISGWAAPEVGETCQRVIALARRLGANNRIYPPLWSLWTNQFVGDRGMQG